MALQILFFAFFREVKPKKSSYKLKILECFTNCSFCWSMLVYQACAAFQASTPRLSYRHFTKSSFTTLMYSLSYVNLGIYSKPTLQINLFTKLILVVWDWSFQSYRNQITKLEKLEQKGWRTAMKRLMEYCITKGYFLS